MKWFSLPNLASTTATVVEAPWTLPAYDYDLSMSKETVRETIWKSPKTKHHFLSPMEGRASNVRVGYDSGNIPLKMYGLIADYDSAANPETMKLITENPPTGVARPRWASITVSNHLRLIWDFEEPVLLPMNRKAVALFMAMMAKRLKLASWYAGLDTKALSEPVQYFELGRQWICYEDSAPVSKGNLDLWIWDATKNAMISEARVETDVPMTALAAEVERRWPGRWAGPFDIGCRGVRFWDETADNPSAARVRPDGMQCFTGDKAFMSWREILGSRFVEQFAINKVKNLLQSALHDGQNYWVLDTVDTGWTKIDSGHFVKWLKCRGIDGKVPKGDTASECDRVEIAVMTQRHVNGAMPFIYQPHGPIMYRNEPILNTSRVKVIDPVPSGTYESLEDAQANGFPFIWAFLSNFLEPVDGQPIQLQYLLSWLKHAYECGYRMKPGPGHIIVLAGAASRGKTFLVTAIMSKLLGGVTDASDNLMGDSTWTSELAKWPIAFIDDDPGSDDFDTHRNFSARIKKMVASQQLAFNGKYMSQGQVEWNGRVVVACNNDAESAKLIPSLDNSTADKIAMLKVHAGSPFQFKGTREENAAMVDQELPAFARYLMSFEYPPELLNHRDPRYRLIPYKHPELRAASATVGAPYATYELLVQFMKSWEPKPSDKGAAPLNWTGTATQLHTEMAKIVGPALGKQTPRTLGTNLGLLEARGVPLYKRRNNVEGTTEWTIPRALTWGKFEPLAGRVMSGDPPPPVVQPETVESLNEEES